MTRSRAARTVFAVAALAFFAKIVLALKTYGTNDVYAYDQFSVWTQYLGVELYHFDPLFNHPPSMIYLLHGLARVAFVTGLPFQFWLRVPAIVADAGTLWLVWKLLGPRVDQRSTFWALVLLAAAPPLILISGFHGNTDSVVIFFLILCIYLVQKEASPWAAGAVYGLAHCVKIFPIIVGLLLVLNLKGTARRTKFCVAAALTVIAAWSPFLFQDPHVLVRNVVGYRSSYGMWGLSYVLARLAEIWPTLSPLNSAFERLGAYVAVSAAWLVSWRLSHRKTNPSLFAQAGLVFFMFLTISSGFGVQYLAWLAPWAVELGWGASALLYAFNGLFLYKVYNYWAEGFPWYLADSNNIGDWRGYFDYAQVLCWCSVALLAWVAWRRLLPVPSISPKIGWSTAIVAGLGVIAIVPPQLPMPKPIGQKFENTVRSINAESYLELSALLSHRGRYMESLETAKRALELAPDAAPEARRIIAIDEAALRK